MCACILLTTISGLRVAALVGLGVLIFLEIGHCVGSKAKFALALLDPNEVEKK